MKKKILSVCFILVSLSIFAQSDLTDEQVSQYTQMALEAEGTYQIQMIDTRETPAITLDLFPQILASRHATEITYLTIKPSMRIMILPLSTVQSPDFHEVERIKHINSSEL